MARDPPGIMDGDEIGDPALFRRRHDRCRQPLNTMEMDQRWADFLQKFSEDLGNATVHYHALDIRIGRCSESSHPYTILKVAQDLVIALPPMDGRENLDVELLRVGGRQVAD